MDTNSLKLMEWETFRSTTRVKRVVWRDTYDKYRFTTCNTGEMPASLSDTLKSNGVEDAASWKKTHTHKKPGEKPNRKAMV